MTTTTSPKPATQTSPRFDRSPAATTLRGSNSERQPQSNRSAGAVKRFLSVLMNSLSAWAV